MAITVFVVSVLLFYFVIWFFDSFFKSCMHYPYYAFLDGTGIKVGFFNFSWRTTAFNRLLYRWGKKAARFLKEWYTVGFIFTITIFLPFSIWVLASTLISNLRNESNVETTTEIKTIIPGVNIPNTDLYAYFVSLALSSIIHELGHAIAAVQEDVSILNVGFYILFVIPIAFVELNSDQLNALSVQRRLRIYCAGVWHNVLLGLLAFSLYFCVSPLSRLGYTTGQGVLVTGFTSFSPLLGSRGLSTMDQIISVNDCKVRDSRDWHSCVYMTKEKFGLCVSSEFISKNDALSVLTYKENDVIDCCRQEDINNLCFEYIEPVYGEVNLASQYSCLKPRDIITEQFVKCSKDRMCLNNDHCLKPLLSNRTSFYIIERLNNDPVLYIGPPSDLSFTVVIDNYVPKYDILSLFSPQAIEKILEYIFMFTLGIAVVNTIPCFGADGHHIARNIIQLVAIRLEKNKEFINITTFCVVLLGTLAMIPCLCYLFVKSIINSR